ncbi:MAG: hypothetical protein NZ528_06045 [Caldilineales bacterium]|nr:hypothetical protein [Caldilineales bacterium]MDW8317414.1 hypothetical protein [Anaerolineae bacterium]
MNKGRNTNWLLVGGAFLAGLLLGWIVLGWWLFPVEWTNATPRDLRPADQQMFLRTVAEAFQANPNPATAVQRLQTLGDRSAVQALLEQAVQDATAAGDLAGVNQLNALAVGVGLSAPAVAAEPTPAEPGGETGGFGVGNLLRLLLGLAVLLLGLALAAWLITRRRAARGEVAEEEETYEVAEPAAPPAYPEREVVLPAAAAARGAAAAPSSRGPLAQQFVATFVPGDETYDETFSIETPDAGYLGECGVSIGEMLNGDPNRVTALEVWLFDKSDIRTVTKVLMSDYAFGNPGLREKLASRGDAVLVQPNAGFVLDAQTLRLEGKIKSLEYLEGEGPPRSAFRRVTVEMRVMRQPAA